MGLASGAMKPLLVCMTLVFLTTFQALAQDPQPVPLWSGGPVGEPAKLHDWTRDCATWLKVEGFGKK